MNQKANDFMNALEEKFMGPLGNFSQTKFVRAIMNTGMATIPFTIVGSMFLVLNVLPMTFPALEGFFNATFFRFSDLYMLANKATMGILALFFVIILGYEYTKTYIQDEKLNLDPLNGALLSVMAFFMVIPQIVFEDGYMTLVNVMDDSSQVINGLDIGADGITRLGTMGIFSGIIMAIVAVEIYRISVQKNWTIKMPEAVPQGVSKAFTALIPAFLVALVIIILQGILVALGTDIFQLVAIPFGFVTNIANSWAGLMLVVFLLHALWIVGIHGGTIITSLVAPITLANMQTNVEGAVIPFAGDIWNVFIHSGGSGATLGLTIWMAFRAKSEQLGALGKVSIVPGIFNINEPVIFGMPILYNPIMAIPFIIAPMVTATISYVTINIGLVDPIIAQNPWPAPVGLGAFIATAGDWKSIVLAVFNVLVAFAIYYPFLKMYDKRLVDEELANIAE
ncbi:PTS system, cellobiose-specific IIC component [Atopostipes suicloacalis DSM 15692]|uniref:Permease IIC component n=1 Tax=Atopostipes suicloacalis DSM 15692 TaxID=1121025 RepID=A0A1M4YKW4_9LACT|nr:PTS cellobiose transporter subunit IIC [Atopostipes suicloacalis]SHF06162.1 PTS system, cellobiose-specific IIC component [Atopostipes suicloacalis DSM 15692]